MICPKSQSQQAEPIVSWTISGRKNDRAANAMVGLWNVIISGPGNSRIPPESPASLPRPHLMSQEVPSGPSMG